MSNNDDHHSITLSENYSGACNNKPFTNEDIFNLTDQQGYLIYGPTLFALKYRVIPCKLYELTEKPVDLYSDAVTYGLNGAFKLYSRGAQWSSKRKQGGMYHVSRLAS